MRSLSLLLRLALLTILTATFSVSILAAELQTVELNGQTWTLPAEFQIEQIAGPPLVDRPITADFDELGRLYVADSSGSNDPVAKQLAEKPHRILRLVDTDGDGRFDTRTVFADQMMFPEGTLWYDGSLYVSAPPSIWRLTDRDDDGVAEEREEWFQGKTLTGCANDLHGPYLGPDGWIYWCKGAFAEQTYERPGRPPLVTKASHIFRCRPNAPRDPATGSIATSAIESVMTGGMDNPVDVAFTATGERILTNTFFVHPGNGQRDGLIHALYGGVYGKQHGVLDGHLRTGELLPVLAHLGPAAPCGLVHTESARLGAEYQHNLFACCFNMHKVTRHMLTENAAALSANTEDFLVSSNIDFHPTDVLEDADGSMVVVDTGGWYKLCCPTSQLWKPDVLGAIYRVSRKGTAPLPDARGIQLNWTKCPVEELVTRLGDPRHAVRQRAIHQLGQLGTTAIGPVVASLATASPQHWLAAVWTLARIEDPAALAAIRDFLKDDDATVRQAALHVISLRRDAAALPQLVEFLQRENTESRLAAEALGRIGDPRAIPELLAAAGRRATRAQEHALIYAMLEIGDVGAIRAGLDSPQPRTVRAAAIALDQLQDGGLKPEQVIAWLQDTDSRIHEMAAWILSRHPEWGNSLAGYLRKSLLATTHNDRQLALLDQQLQLFANQSEVQRLLADLLESGRLEGRNKQLVLGSMWSFRGKEVPPDWRAALLHELQRPDAFTMEAVATARTWPPTAEALPEFNAALRKVADAPEHGIITRLQALAAFTGPPEPLSDAHLQLALQNLAQDQHVAIRSTALDVLSKSRLTEAQLQQITTVFATVGPLEAGRLLPLFEQSQSPAVAGDLLAALEKSPALTSLRVDALQRALAKYPPEVQVLAQPLYRKIMVDLEQQQAQLAKLVEQTKGGDIRRGFAVFSGTKGACISCHQMGYLGGNIGPDLTKIGKIRTERDLLEALVFPNASFVRSYEPVTVLLNDGRVQNGILKEEAGTELVLVKSATETIRISREDVEEIRPSNVSVMPSGFAQQLTTQELADLIAFLKSLQ